MSAKEQIDLYKSHWMNPGLQSTCTDPNPNPKEHPQAHFLTLSLKGWRIVSTSKNCTNYGDKRNNIYT